MISLISAKSETIADSLIKSNNTSFLKKVIIYPITKWQRISYKSDLLNCQFYPSCSNYCSISIDQHGVFLGMIIGMDRINRCNSSAPYYQKKINGSYKKDDGRLIDHLDPPFNAEGKKSEILSIVIGLVPGLGKTYYGRAYDGFYGVLNLLISLQAYSVAKENKNKTMTKVFGLTSLLFYSSEIYGSWRAAKYYQQKNIN